MLVSAAWGHCTIVVAGGAVVLGGAMAAAAAAVPAMPAAAAAVPPAAMQTPHVMMGAGPHRLRIGELVVDLLVDGQEGLWCGLASHVSAFHTPRCAEACSAHRRRTTAPLGDRLPCTPSPPCSMCSPRRRGHRVQKIRSWALPSGFTKNVGGVVIVPLSLIHI